MFVRQFLDEAARDGAGPLAEDTAIGSVQDRAFAPCPRDRDISEAAFLLQRGEPAFVERALRRKHAFFPAGQEDVVELQPFGGMHGHDGDLLVIALRVIVHDEADML